jgi:hypothetical protein
MGTTHRPALDGWLATADGVLAEARNASLSPSLVPGRWDNYRTEQATTVGWTKRPRSSSTIRIQRPPHVRRGTGAYGFCGGLRGTDGTDERLGSRQCRAGGRTAGRRRANEYVGRAVTLVRYRT